VPLVQRAYALWEELERLSGRRILVRTGGLMLGPRDGVVVAGALASARTHGLSYEELSAAEVARRVPGIRPPADAVGVWEPRAGFLDPEAAIEAHLALAASSGAELRTGEAVLRWGVSGGVAEVTTTHARYRGRRLVLAAGAWMRDLLLPELALPLVVERNVMHWFRPERPTDLFSAERFPIFIHEYAPGLAWYGFPDVGDGVKLALHHHGTPVDDPDALRRDVAADEVAHVRTLLRAFTPAADGPVVQSAVCMYTNTPDDHFVIDAHPAHPEVIVASPCSGHGFKFSSAVGELLAQMVTTGRSAFDLTPFRISRFRGSTL
ncbi:MAG TPA: N-methyl-L-tryptophan oxidase, partial [Gemmatimonadaceae bacterium]|nr:N-methyl-L-tryptophan oxidase [Gemmatimonadaceae bacterium]